MAKRTGPHQNEEGASARYLVLMFLAAVVVCAVFFSLGFVVGYNHSPTRTEPVTENVAASGNIPPAVNPPAGGSGQSSAQGIQTEAVNPSPASISKPERPQPLAAAPPAAPGAAEQTQTHQAAKKPAEKPAAKRTARIKRVAAPRQHTEGRARAVTSSRFAVQVMASRTHTDAENLVKLLKSHGYRVYILTPPEAHAKDHLYRVQVGPYPTRVSADRARDKLVSEGFRPFVVHR